MKLIDETKFEEGLKKEDYFTPEEIKVTMNVLSKHTKDLVDEPQYPSGMDHDKISIRNGLRKELRELDF